jgi:hypothetical protein
MTTTEEPNINSNKFERLFNELREITKLITAISDRVNDIINSRNPNEADSSELLAIRTELSKIRESIELIISESSNNQEIHNVLELFIEGTIEQIERIKNQIDQFIEQNQI